MKSLPPSKVQARGFSRLAGLKRASAAARFPARQAAGAQQRTGPRPTMRDPRRVAVLISGRGSNMRALVQAADGYEMALIASNKPAAEGLAWAEAQGLRTWTHDSKGLGKEEYDR